MMAKSWRRRRLRTRHVVDGVGMDGARGIRRSIARIVKGVTIDSLNLPTDRPVIVKLDVEGYELQPLIGGIDFLDAPMSDTQ